MVKKTIEFKDFNGNERKQDFYFNLSEAEAFDMQMTTVGGYKEMIEAIIAAQDVPELVRLFKELLLKTYGEKSADGLYFRKSEQAAQDFASTNAYVKLYMELVQDDKAAADFINQVIDFEVAEPMMPVNN